MKKIRILIADDHPIVREGYKKILMSQPDMDVTGEAGNGQEVLDLTQKKDFDLILLDISMPGRSGLEILKELKGQKPHLPVMILSIYPEEQYAVRAFRDGASGYLTRRAHPRNSSRPSTRSPRAAATSPRPWPRNSPTSCTATRTRPPTRSSRTGNTRSCFSSPRARR